MYTIHAEFAISEDGRRLRVYYYNTGCMGFLWVTGFSFFYCVASPFHSFVTTTTIHYTKKLILKKPDRTSRQTQAGIGHSTPAHRGGHVQYRSRRRQTCRGKVGPGPQAEQPRMDGGPGRQARGTTLLQLHIYVSI